jgi:hypothetical protein
LIMISKSALPDSGMALMESIHKLSDAGVSLIQVRTREPLRAAVVLRRNLIASETPYSEWDVTNGFRRFTTENLVEHKMPGGNEDFMTALVEPINQIRNASSQVNTRSDVVHYYVYVDPQPYIADNPVILQYIQQYAAILPTTNVCMIFITSDANIQGVPPGSIVAADMTTPSAEELLRVLRRVIKGSANVFTDGVELDEEDMQRLANLGLGLSQYEFETSAATCIIEASANRETLLTMARMTEGISKGKTAIVRQSEILDLSQPEDISNVGGMGRLKDWLKARKNCFSEEAIQFGIESPKGAVLVGVPGTGKSLVAKVTASEFGVPLVKLDFGRVFSKFVGDSESRMRSALNMVESMAPVVLFADEIDKGLGGSGGSADSGVSSRVLGSFLTWLQECKKPVFTIVTANRVDGLPPELLRRGRFDGVFSVGMPNPDERLEVLTIHLRKRDRNIKKFNRDQLDEFVKASEGYVPAEIESAVKDGIIAAFNDESAKDLEMRHIIDALHEMVPMSKSHKEAIDRMVQWAKDNATPVSYPVGAADLPKPTILRRNALRSGS